MVRDLEKEAKKIRNGNRYVQAVDGRGVFPRDSDRLFLEYKNLRGKIYSDYRESFRDEATKQELRSYIDEQFIKLVKEYDINSPVDFPGYIKKKLGLRVKQTFVKNQFRDKGRESLTKNEGDIEGMLEGDADTYEVDNSDLDLLEFVFSHADFTEVQKDILDLWLTKRRTDKEIQETVSQRHGIKPKQVETDMSELRQFVLYKVELYNKE